MRHALAAASLLLVACSSDDEPFKDCALGELTGTWRVTYDETNGSCGRLSDETVVLKPGEASSACKYDSQAISADKCRIDLDFTCPLAPQGSQRWIGALRHVAADRIEGSMTLQGTDGRLVCRSTYDVTWTRQ